MGLKTDRSTRRRRGIGIGLTLLALLLATIAWLGLTPTVAHAESAANREYQVKAAFITKFIPFIEWPTNSFKRSDDPVLIAVINDPAGHDPFEGALDQFAAGRISNGRPLRVKHVDPDADLSEYHVVFVPGSQDARLKMILKSTENLPVLTVGESDNFPWAGGAVRFFLEDNKVRFEANTDAIKTANLTVSSKFLALAKLFKK